MQPNPCCGALRLFESLDYEWAAAVCSSLLASVLVRNGVPADIDEAASLLGSALTLHDRVGDRRGVAQSLEVLAEVALARGSAATAGRLAGAAAFRRDQVDVAPTEGESRRLADLDARLQRISAPPPPTTNGTPDGRCRLGCAASWRAG